MTPPEEPAWRRRFTFEELPGQWRQRLGRVAEFIEEEHGPGPYARRAEDVTQHFLETLNYPPNATAARDAARVDPSGSVEMKTRRVLDVRLERAWQSLYGPFRDTLRKVDAAIDGEAKSRVDESNPWSRLDGWQSEPILPIHTLSRKRGDKYVEEAEEPGYLIYNQLVSLEHYRPFRTSAGDARIAIPSAFGLEVHDPTSQGGDLSRDFLRRVSYSLFVQKGRAVPGRELAVAVSALVGRALARELPRERVVELAVRVAAIAPVGCRLDLADDRHRCVVLEPGSWRVEDVGHPVFDSRRHMLPLPDPTRAGDGGWERLRELWRFVSLAPKSGADDPELLATALLVQFLLSPASPKPVVIITGEEGVGKTSGAARLGSVVDPSLVPVVRPPTDDDALLNLAMNHAVINIDNVSFISHELSDDLARLSTGIGLPKRRLFTDSDEVIANAKPLLILNGITATPSAADLLRRALVLVIVAPNPVRPQAELDAEWKGAHPRILAGLLDLSAAAAQVLQSGPRLSSVSSMADFVRVGQAVAIAMGRPASDFLAAWEVNVERQSSAASENPWVSALYDYFRNEPIDGEPRRADSIATHINEFDRVTFPKGVTSQAVGNAIARVKKTLARMGIHLGRRMVHGMPHYQRVAAPETAASVPLEQFAGGGSSTAGGGPEPEGGGPPGQSEVHPAQNRQSSGQPLQGDRPESLSLESPGVNLGEPPSEVHPKLGEPEHEVHPGSPSGSPSFPTSAGEALGEPGEPKTPGKGETPLSSTPAGRGNPGKAGQIAIWASPGCKDCPACNPPHETPVNCSCTRCDPFGHSSYSSAGRTHYCGTVDGTGSTGGQP